MLGVQYLTNLTANDLGRLSLTDIEDIVGNTSNCHNVFE